MNLATESTSSLAWSFAIGVDVHASLQHIKETLEQTKDSTSSKTIHYTYGNKVHSCTWLPTVYHINTRIDHLDS